MVVRVNNAFYCNWLKCLENILRRFWLDWVVILYECSIDVVIVW